MDTLKGNLELFGLESITGLLASARKTGALRISVDGLNGRLFFVDGALVYATTRKHDGSVNDLRGRGTEVRDRRRAWSLSLPELLRHQITDVLVRILRRDGGEFLFDEGVTTTALPSGRTLSFSAAEMIQRAQERLDEWGEIEEAIPDSTVKYRLAPQLPPDLFEVAVDARMWTFIAAIGDGASASDLAERLRIFEFPAAKKMAEFVREGLLVAVDAAEVAEALRNTRAARSSFAEEQTDEAPPDVKVTMIAAPDDVESADAEEVDTDADQSDPADVVQDGGETGTDVSPEPEDDESGEYAVGTRSEAVAEWGETGDGDDRATVDTQGASELVAEVGVEHVADDEEDDASTEAAAPTGTDLADALPEVPAPPPWIPQNAAPNDGAAE